MHIVTRREALVAVGALGTLALGRGLPALAQAPTLGPFIDIHHHHYPRAWKEATNAWQARHGLGPAGGPAAAWTPQRSIEEMDRTGIRTAILSLASPRKVWWDIEPARIPAVARSCNEDGAELGRRYPGRFGLLAALPMPDVDAALRETAYALDQLDADGIGLPTSFGDRWPGDPAFAPLWSELDRRRALVVFHPYAPNCCAGVQRGVAESYLEYPADTGRAVLSLLLSGTLARYRNVRWTFCHGGGPVPVIAGRIASLATFQERRLAEVAPDGVEAELRRLYFDTANATARPALAALLAFAPPAQILFGTDYPYVSGAENANGLAAAALPDATRVAIARGNAQRLLPRWRT